MKKNNLLAKTAIAAGIMMTLTACTINVQPGENPDVAPINVEKPDTKTDAPDIPESPAPGTDEEGKEENNTDNNASKLNYDYSDVIDFYSQWLSNEVNGTGEYNEDISVGVSEVSIYSDDAFSELGYTLTDISGDGNDELIIATNETYSGNTRVLAVYGMTEDGPVLVIEGASRYCYYILDDNRYFLEGSGGAGAAVWEVGALNNEGTECVTERFVYSECWEDEENIYINNTGEFTHNDDELAADYTMDDFVEDEAKYEAMTVSFELTPFEYLSDGDADTIYVCFGEEVENDVSDFTEVDLSVNDNYQRIAIGSRLPMYNFKFYSLTVKDLDEDSILFDKEELFGLDENPTYFPVIVNFNLMGDLPEYGFSCSLTEDGEEECFAIGFSGEDGSPYFFGIDE